ncbi:hypothetical protein [Candidatus Oscillochloris fontis]|uniref:hypothetical protein n=1 Tax=Candidatus Oscillochloris fontis TaxID=2496868 RepID=UPI00101C58FD|nr:hypothetical protein [Candidatus Oscillochloris fontis]
MLLWLAFMVILFEIWYVAAFITAYLRLNESRLLLLVGQGLMILLAFLYILYADRNQLQVNPLIALAPLLVAMIAMGLWRVLAPKLPRFHQSYPRGFVDVLLFRRPQLTNLKRRVRTK